MAKTPALGVILAGCLLLVGVAPLQAQVKVEQLLTFTPKQKDVSYSTPSADEIASCKVELVKGARAGSSGWALLDGKGQKLRLFFDSNGDKSLDVWSYFKDGVEVYREIDTNNNKIADQYRWLNTGGMKWGVSQAEDGKISAWRMISAEEVGQEAFQALATRDYARLKALFISDADIQALKLPTKEVQRIAALQQKAATKFQEVTNKLPQLAKATFLRVEGTPPGCVLAEQAGSETDIIKYTNRSILYQTETVDAAGKKDIKHEWLSTGELIQVGFAWRLIDVPTSEEGNPITDTVPNPTNPKLNDLLDKLAEHDKKQIPQAPPLALQHLGDRIKLVEQVQQIVTEPKDKENWQKQLFDNYAALAQLGDKDASTKLSKLTLDVVSAQPGSNLAAYARFRELWTLYALEMKDISQPQMPALQSKWLDQLEKYVQSYPKCDETTPEALLQLALGNEFNGKDDVARRYYAQLSTLFKDHPLAEKANGAATRLGLIGKELTIQGTQFNGKNFDLKSQRGKLVLVCFWSSDCSQCVGDFARMKKTYDEAATRNNIEYVLINLDSQVTEANQFLKSTPCPGIHLHAGPNGLNSPLATQYGINGMPTMFLVGRDGKVVNNRLQIGDLESELKKAN